MERKKRYFSRIMGIFEKHGLVDESLRWEDVHRPLVRGTRALIQAAHEPAIAWHTEMEKAFQNALDVAESDREFATTLYRLAKRYGRILPRHIPPEAKISQIAEIPLQRITPNSKITRVPKGGDALTKYLLMRDIEALTRHATSPRSRRRP